MLITAPKLKTTFLERVETIVGPKAFSNQNLDRLNYSRDSNFKSVIQIKYNKVEYFPDIIVWPSHTEQVQKLVKLAIKFKMPIVPYGAGSGVCGGTVAVKGGMIIDLKRMRSILKMDDANLTVTAESGVMGKHLEDELHRKGYTLGHFPSSILCASLGGYLAARSAGQTSSRYGKIEDMTRDLEIVTGGGEIIQTGYVSNTSGIDLNQIFLGSEGTLGLITKATLKIYPLAEHQEIYGVRFRNFQTGIEALRRLMQSGLKPSVVRLYDEVDSLLFSSGSHSDKDNSSQLPINLKSIQQFLMSHSLKNVLRVPQAMRRAVKLLPTGCILIVMHEGAPRLVREEQKIALEIFEDLDGKYLGQEIGEHWLKHRYSVSYKASTLFNSGAFTDTIEIAASWEKLFNLYKTIAQAISPHALVMAHLSHVYTDGGSIYFTFVAPLNGLKKSEELYDLIWHKAMTTCQKEGGAISHHHGIGRLKAKYMEKEWGAGLLLFKKFKELYDPHNIMNPGKMFELKKEKAKQAA